MDLVNPNFVSIHPSITCTRGWLMLLCTQEYCSSIKSGVKSESHLSSMLCCDFSLLCCGKTEWVTDSNRGSTSMLFCLYTRKAHVVGEKQRNLHTTKRVVTDPHTWVPAHPDTAPEWEHSDPSTLCRAAPPGKHISSLSTASCARGGLGWISGKDFSSRGWLSTEQGSGHSTKLARVQIMFGQCSQVQGGIVGVSCTEPGAGLDNPCRSLATQDSLILWFFLALLPFQHTHIVLIKNFPE